MARFQHLEVYHDLYKFVRDLYKLKQKLPQALKHDLGHLACLSALRALKGITVANGSLSKGRALYTVLLEIDSLWVQLRLMYDLKGISKGEFEVMSALLSKVQPQIQNWIKWDKKRPADALSANPNTQ
jgi:hypothetical protein